MSDEFLGERKRFLEEEFFRKREKALLEQARIETARKSQREVLAAAAGITDEAKLQRLLDLRIQPETLLALRLVPLVEVAWADGSLDERERRAVMEAVASVGVRPGTVAHAMVESWLVEPPGPGLREAWVAYVQGLGAHLSPAERADVRRATVERARAVAEATGGFLGLGSKVSPAEEEVLRQLDGAFAG